jgi:hypothetical protein
MREHRRLTTLWASTASYRGGFTLLLLILFMVVVAVAVAVANELIVKCMV